MCECHDEAPHEFEWDCACADCMSTMMDRLHDEEVDQNAQPGGFEQTRRGDGV